jgi:hypothetical protein
MVGSIGKRFLCIQVPAEKADARIKLLFDTLNRIQNRVSVRGMLAHCPQEHCGEKEARSPARSHNRDTNLTTAIRRIAATVHQRRVSSSCAR